jgi:hypothetical protein
MCGIKSFSLVLHSACGSVSGLNPTHAQNLAVSSLGFCNPTTLVIKFGNLCGMLLFDLYNSLLYIPFEFRTHRIIRGGVIN